jgi:hypothetical protein
MEGIRLYEIMTNQKNVPLRKEFWTKTEGSNQIPERSAVSLQNFWAKISCKTLEQYLVECIHEGTDFCLSFKEIPNPGFVHRFKQQYEQDFLNLQAFDEVSDNPNEQSFGNHRPSASRSQVSDLSYQRAGLEGPSRAVSETENTRQRNESRGAEHSVQIDTSTANLVEGANPFAGMQDLEERKTQMLTPRQRAQSFTREESKLQHLAADDIYTEEENKIYTNQKTKTGKPTY